MTQGSPTLRRQERKNPGKGQPQEDRASPLRKLYKLGGDRRRVKRHVTFSPRGGWAGSSPLSTSLLANLLPSAPTNFRGRRERVAQMANRD